MYTASTTPRQGPPPASAATSARAREIAQLKPEDTHTDLARPRSLFPPPEVRAGNTADRLFPSRRAARRNRGSRILRRAAAGAQFRAALRRSPRDCETQMPKSPDQKWNLQKEALEHPLQSIAMQCPPTCGWHAAAWRGKNRRPEPRLLSSPLSASTQKPCPRCRSTDPIPAHQAVPESARKFVPLVATTTGPH